MALHLFFGLPGVGKTTLLTKLIYDFSDFEHNFHNPKYAHIYSNVDIKIPGIIKIENSDIGKYDIRDGALFIDEASLFADNRNFKEFGTDKLRYFVLHRHKNIDVYLFTQFYNGIDLKLRNLCVHLYYMYKPFLLGFWETKYYKIHYGLIIPRGKDNDKLGDIIEGYSQPSFFEKVFCKRIWRPKYYKYFDSYEDYYLPPLPQGYEGYKGGVPTRTLKFGLLKKKSIKQKDVV